MRSERTILMVVHSGRDEVTETARRVEKVLRDNGIGFRQEEAERIFNVFQRLHGSAEFTGNGIGLAIVRKVIENHKGFIWAEGKPDKGSAFYVMLPKN